MSEFIPYEDWTTEELIKTLEFEKDKLSKEIRKNMKEELKKRKILKSRKRAILEDLVTEILKEDGIEGKISYRSLKWNDVLFYALYKGCTMGCLLYFGFLAEHKKIWIAVISAGLYVIGMNKHWRKKWASYKFIGQFLVIILSLIILSAIFGPFEWPEILSRK